MSKPSWLTVAVAGAGGFFAGVLLIAVLGGPKGVVRTTTEHRTATVTHTVDGRERVPGVVGQRLPDARSTVEDAGFEVDVVTDSLFGVVDENNWDVVQQEPRGGERLAAGQTVTLTVQRR